MTGDLNPLGSDEIIIVPYSNNWPILFEMEKKRLLDAEKNAFISIEHFGSTAVPGMAAKPVIDIAGGMHSMKDADSIIPKLQELGYLFPAEFNATLINKRWLMRLDEDKKHRTHHLHLMIHNGDDWKNRLAFRDTLRASPETAKEYENLKRDLANRFRNDREGYSNAKKEFIARLG